MGLFVLLTFWRTIDYALDMWYMDEGNLDVPAPADVIVARRWCTLHHFGHFFLDIPFILCFLVVSLSVYRAPSLWSDILNEHNVNARRPLCGWAFLNLLLDLPFIVLGLVLAPCIWRLPGWLRDLFRDFWNRTAADRRRATAENLGLALADIPTFGAGLLLALSGYRMASAVDELRGPKGRSFCAEYVRPPAAGSGCDRWNPHRIVWKHFLK
jgi:hypothetical protein